MGSGSACQPPRLDQSKPHMRRAGAEFLDNVPQPANERYYRPAASLPLVFTRSHFLPLNINASSKNLGKRRAAVFRWRPQPFPGGFPTGGAGTRPIKGLINTDLGHLNRRT